MSVPHFEDMARKGVFPPYEYKAYPKWITLKSGEQVIVQSQREHIDRIATDGELPAEDNPLQRERDALMERLARVEQENLQLKIAAAKTTPTASVPMAPALAAVANVKPLVSPTTVSVEDLLKL